MSRHPNPPGDPVPMPTTATPDQAPEPIIQAPVPDEHLTVLADAVRDDSDHYDDPPLAAS